MEDGSFQALGIEDYAIQGKSPPPPAMDLKFICCTLNPQCDGTRSLWVVVKFTRDHEGGDPIDKISVLTGKGRG